MKISDFIDFDKLLEEATAEAAPDGAPPVTLDLDQMQANISQYTTEKLCEMIVCDRYLGLEKKVSDICMEELAKRRIAGDPFDFETHIDTAYKSLPVLEFVIPDVRSLLSQAMRKGVKSKL
jgi:hypothetical protein